MNKAVNFNIVNRKVTAFVLLYLVDSFKCFKSYIHKFEVNIFLEEVETTID